MIPHVDNLVESLDPRVMDFLDLIPEWISGPTILCAGLRES